MNKRDRPQISYTIWIQKKKKYAIIWLLFCFCLKIKRRNFQNFFEIVNMTNSIIVTFKQILFHFCIYLQTIMLRFKTHIYYVIQLYTFSTFQHTSISYFSFFLYYIFCSSSICLNLFQQLGYSNYKHICIQRQQCRWQYKNSTAADAYISVISNGGFFKWDSARPFQSTRGNQRCLYLLFSAWMIDL